MRNKNDLKKQAENIEAIIITRGLMTNDKITSTLEKEVVKRVDGLLVSISCYMNQKEEMEYGDLVYNAWEKINKDQDWLDAYTAYHRVIRPILIA